MTNACEWRDGENAEKDFSSSFTETRASKLDRTKGKGRVVANNRHACNHYISRKLILPRRIVYCCLLIKAIIRYRCFYCDYIRLIIPAGILALIVTISLLYSRTLAVVALTIVIIDGSHLIHHYDPRIAIN